MSLAASYMLQTCTVTAPGEPDAWGERTAGTTVTTACRFVRRQERAKTPYGTLLLSRAVVYLPAGVSVAAGDTVSVDGEAEEYRVMQAQEVRGLGGTVDHWKALLT